MNNRTTTLLSIGKIGSGISLICVLFLIISTFALKDVGFMAALVISALASLAALISSVMLVASGGERPPLLILMLVFNIILMLIYTAVTVYIFFIVPMAVNEMMNS